MFQCEECGCSEFYAQMNVTMDVKVDCYGKFLDTMPDDARFDVSDGEEPFGPYECVECGATYDELG